MSAMPPPGGSNYPRPSVLAPYGSAARLQSLADGYFMLIWAFLANFVVYFVLIGFGQTSGRQDLLFGSIGLLFLVSALLSYFPNRKVVEGLGKAPSTAILYSLLVGVLSFICCTSLGYAVVQIIAANEIRRYGLA